MYPRSRPGVAIVSIGVIAIVYTLATSAPAKAAPGVSASSTAKLPSIWVFSATPPVVAPGYSATLTWVVDPASDVRIEPGVGTLQASGSVLVHPTVTTTYTLYATNGGGTQSASLQVTVTGAYPGPAGERPRIASFTATPGAVSVGASAVLAWNVIDATSVSIDQGIGNVSASGTFIVAPWATTKYTLTADNGGEQSRAEVVVWVNDGPCAISDETLCLSDGRFRVAVAWKDFQGNKGLGHAQQVTKNSGQFWFFNSDNVELMIKVLDGRATNGKFWVFYGALSNIEYTITVTDTQTGAVRTYQNPPGNFASVGDTSAF